MGGGAHLLVDALQGVEALEHLQLEQASAGSLGEGRGGGGWGWLKTTMPRCRLPGFFGFQDVSVLGCWGIGCVRVFGVSRAPVKEGQRSRPISFSDHSSEKLVRE